MAKGSNKNKALNTPIQDKMEKLTLNQEGTRPTEEVQAPPLLASYNDRIRPLLDAVDRLRHLNVMKEGIQLPTIVVVGDQSSGKSSVLESLAGISLPRGQGICTRVPLIMRLQHHPTTVPELHLEYQGKTVKTDEANISLAITNATDEIAGDGKGISNTPLTLVVRKKGVPDLTMVDLPGITRVPEGLLEKVTADDVNIGLGYICVRNRIGDESYEEARAVEARLFESHPLLSKIDKSIVGVPVLAQKLVQIQAGSIARCLPRAPRDVHQVLSYILNCHL